MSLIPRPPFPYIISLPTLKIMAFAFVPNYHVNSQSAFFLNKRNSPLRDHLRSRTNARPRKGLWVHFSSYLVKEKAVVRQWCRRRMRSALMEELQKRGFDKDGRHTGDGMGRGEGEGEGEGEEKKSDLAGTLELIAHKGLLVTERSEVCRQAGLIARRVEEMCRNRNGTKMKVYIKDKGARKRP